MTDAVVQWCIELIRTNGAMTIFVTTLVEAVVIPLPTPLIMMAAGAILVDHSLSGFQSFVLIMLEIGIPGGIATALGAYVGYGLGYWGGKPLIERYQRFLGFDWNDVCAVEKRFVEGHAGPILFFSRAVPVVPLIPVSVAAGAVRMPAHPYFIWTLLGSIPRCLILGYIGWALHKSYIAMAQQFALWASIVSVLFIAGIIALIVWLKIKNKIQGKTTA